MVSKSEKTAKMEARHSEARASLLTRAWTPSDCSAHGGAFLLQILFFLHWFTDQIGTLTLNLAPKGTISDTL